jgi:uncharacterized membrane protein
MLAYVVAWVVAAIAFPALDALWFSWSVSRFYKPIIGEIMRPKFSLAPAIAFYVIYASAIVYFGVRIGLQDASLASAALNGALLGFFAYATFDLSNQAILRVWSTKLSVVDMAWGTVATATASAIAYEVASLLA